MPRSMEPSSLMVSGLEAKKLRVKRTFSATSSCDQPGKELRSMLPPQLAATLLPSVCLRV